MEVTPIKIKETLPDGFEICKAHYRFGWYVRHQSRTAWESYLTTDGQMIGYINLGCYFDSQENAEVALAMYRLVEAGK